MVSFRFVILPLAVGFGIISELLPAVGDDRPWVRHTVDDSSRGADGVRLGDVNGDGLPDIATGWEEGGVTRICLHPGKAKVRARWPGVTVGNSPSVEDAVWADLDHDGALDVISCCEGRDRSVRVAWNPGGEDLLSGSDWENQDFPALRGRSQWMFAVPVPSPNGDRTDLLIGSKGAGGVIGLLHAPEKPRQPEDWQWQELRPAGWIMSMQLHDLDGDGDQDLLVSDRKGERRGVFWLENPGMDDSTTAWSEHRIGGRDGECMFLDTGDIDGDGILDVVVAVKPDQIRICLGGAIPGQFGEEEVIRVGYSGGLGRAKAVAAGDLDGDGWCDLVYSCEGATPPAAGVIRLMQGRDTSGNTTWRAENVSGPKGIKFDRIELLDADSDGDLDIFTCEERHQGKGLGVIWYENPQLSP